MKAHEWILLWVSIGTIIGSVIAILPRPWQSAIWDAALDLLTRIAQTNR